MPTYPILQWVHKHTIRVGILSLVTTIATMVQIENAWSAPSTVEQDWERLRSLLIRQALNVPGYRI